MNHADHSAGTHRNAGVHRNDRVYRNAGIYGNAAVYRNAASGPHAASDGGSDNPQGGVDRRFPHHAVDRRTVLKGLGAAGLAITAGAVFPEAAAAGTAARTAGGAMPSWDWSRPSRVSTTSPSLQVVVNPLIRRGSPIHDTVFRGLRALHADYVRFVPWKPYPRLGVAELRPPHGRTTSWDFSLIDPLMADFERATRGHRPIVNFSTIPQWMWRGPWEIDNGQLHVVGGGNATAATGFNWTDYVFEADVTPEATATHSGQPYAQAGMVFRMDSGGNNGYALLISNYPYTSPARPGYVVFVPIAGGRAGASQKRPLPFAITGGQSYHVAITAIGETFTVAVDGVVVDTVTDSTYATGSVGFREYGAESGRFDNVTVTAADGTVLLTDDFSDGLGQWDTPPVVPDDPNAKVGYSLGTQLAVPVETVGEYYRRLVSWYTAGGFTDEAGAYHASGHHYSLPYWEVLNELEHGLDAQLYTQLYDAIVSGIREVSPATKFVGLAFATPGPSKVEFVRYFLDPANHRPGVPIDMISYHFYAHVTGDGQDEESYGPAGFARADSFLSVVDQIEAVRKEMAPAVRTTVDEVGTIMDAAATQADPVSIPNAYWNFSAAIYAYVLANLAVRGIDVVAQSQLVGYPSQYPSVSMVNWDTGLPNARYRVLQLLLGEMAPGSQLIEPDPDAMPSTCFALGLQGHGPRRILLVNKSDGPVSVPLPGRGVRALVVDQRSGGGPIRVERDLPSEFVLGGYAVAVIHLSH